MHEWLTITVSGTALICEGQNLQDNRDVQGARRGRGRDGFLYRRCARFSRLHHLWDSRPLEGGAPWDKKDSCLIMTSFQMIREGRVQMKQSVAINWKRHNHYIKLTKMKYCNNQFHMLLQSKVSFKLSTFFRNLKTLSWYWSKISD